MQHLIERWVAGPQSKDVRELWFNYVVRLSDGTAIGHVQATVHSSWAEVAWVLGTPWWGKGLWFETATLLLRELRRTSRRRRHGQPCTRTTFVASGCWFGWVSRKSRSPLHLYSGHTTPAIWSFPVHCYEVLLQNKISP